MLVVSRDDTAASVDVDLRSNEPQRFAGPVSGSGGGQDTRLTHTRREDTSVLSFIDCRESGEMSSRIATDVVVGRLQSGTQLRLGYEIETLSTWNNYFTPIFISSSAIR